MPFKSRFGTAKMTLNSQSKLIFHFFKFALIRLQWKIRRLATLGELQGTVLAAITAEMNDLENTLVQTLEISGARQNLNST